MNECELLKFREVYYLQSRRLALWFVRFPATALLARDPHG